MKKYWFLLCLTLVSCTAIKQLNDEKVTIKSQCANIQYVNNIPTIEIIADNTKTRFLFDTGATGSVLTDSTIIENFSKKEMGSLGSGRAAGNTKFKRKQITAHMHSDIFDSDNKVLSFLSMPESACKSKSNSFTGIIGLDVFFEKKLSLLLDFSNATLCNISPERVKKLLMESNYQIVKSVCKLNQIFIFIKIENKEYRFKFDTGFSGNILLKSDGALLAGKNPENKIEIDGSLYQTAASLTNGKELFFQKVPVTLGLERVFSKANVSSSVPEYIVGIEFIKGFDWIIDYNNNKVYAKRNNNDLSSSFKRKVSYYAKVQNGKLRVSAKEISQTKYNLADEITSVNGQPVTAENNCEMQDLLNKTDDWNALQLEVVPGKK